jgi:steroid 5-alpha reductase family enzyme
MTSTQLLFYQLCLTPCLLAYAGALFLFYPYNFKDGDLSRYQYAKHKWVIKEKLPPWLWPLKAQLDTLTQCFANSVILACPILLASLNPTQELHWLEVAGGATWAGAWVLENMADTQKLLFLADCKQQAKQATTSAEKERLKLSVLGFTEPFNSPKYWLWTKCRHPNYFFEWVAWIGFGMIGFGSVATKDAWLLGGEGLSMTALLSATLLLMLRFFYDCLVYWTGSAPAEQQSVRKRPEYPQYQACTRVFFPFSVPAALVDHHKTPGWPLDAQDRADNDDKCRKQH